MEFRKKANQPFKHNEDQTIAKRIKKTINALFRGEGIWLVVTALMLVLTDFKGSTGRGAPSNTLPEKETATNQNASTSQTAEHTDVDELRDHTDSNQVDLAYKPHINRDTGVDATSTKRKDLKRPPESGAFGPVTNASGPIKQVEEIFVECVDAYKVPGEAKVEYDELIARLERLFEGLMGYFEDGCSHPMTASMERLCKSIQEELKVIKDKNGRNVGARYLAANDEADAILGRYRRVEGYLERLSLNANPSMWKIAHEQATNYQSDPRYNSAEAEAFKRRECTPNTRVQEIAMILGWVRNQGDGPMYWLNGMAGTGKTTIAYSTCAALDSAHMLGASFFCSRLREECRDVNMIIPSIAYQLARFSRPFHHALCNALEKDPDAHVKRLHMQFNALIKDPILQVQHTLPEELTVVIDALDECDNKESTGRMLDVLLRESARLPIKFVLSSRPEPEIRDQMSERVRSRLVLHELDKGKVQVDIETYLRVELSPMSPSEAQIAALVERAGILFIYAATAVRYIGHDDFRRNPNARLRTLLGVQQVPKTKRNDEIDELYTTILEAALGDQGIDEEEQGDREQVMYTVICAREPLTVGDLSELLQVKDVERVRAALRPLWSVFHVVGGNELVTTLGASFPEFMFDLTRSKAYHCNSEAHNRALAEHCFQCIEQTQPQINICELDTSHIPDEEVPNLEERIDRAVSSVLFYACRYWSDHLAMGGFSQSVIKRLHDFLSARLLLWMEVMNLKKQMKAAVQCMKLIVDFCNEYEGGTELASLAHDAKNFVEAFASNPVSQSTPHIYISSLQLCPRSSTIYRIYSNYVENLLKPHGRIREHRGVATSDYQPWEIGSGVLSIAYSLDGTRVAVGCENGTVNLLHAQNGIILVGPLNGHTDWVRCVVFSPDGAYVLSASSDCTIRMWNTLDGTPVDVPFKGHTYPVKSVAFSPNGRRVVSGSWDNTVRVWNAADGTPAMEPLEGHKWGVNCVAFSPDGTFVASGANDHTVRLWGLFDDTPISKVLEGHTNAVMSIAFTPDGTRLVSGSVDCTICIWDMYAGLLMTRLVQGCTHLVYSVAISPDGSYIASGAADSTIRIWNIDDGRLVAGPFVGHSGGVRSVIFSPSGSRILSGSIYCSHPNGNATDSMNRGFLKPNHQLSRLLEGWRYRPDGWVVDDRTQSQLLFWTPSPSVALRIINQALFLTTIADSKALPRFSELKLGNWW
ncbi:unnamed protein product [Rhizoctonia solani]|uniref:Nephrocystin 3-like N-terminal domain-containing protein n=1 Tax=Rhizoctonia solani TaxID=456999 RepID=A0A8H3CET0_9AGAM|nr:unnamed protein product [Rhizoctonia solani]